MQSFRLAINYNGRWDDLDYVDGELIGKWVENKLSYNELVEMTYRLTGIGRSIYDIILYRVIKLRSHWTKYRVKRDNDIDFVFRDNSPIKEIYIDMEKRVGGGTGAGGDAHVHKLPPSFFKYDNVGYYTTDSDTEDEKPNEQNFSSSSDDTFIGVEQSVGVDDGIGGTKNCGGAGRVTFGSPSHDPFLAAPSCWILPCVGQYSFGTTPATSISQEGTLFVGQVFDDKHKLKIELGLYAMHERMVPPSHVGFNHLFYITASANVIGQLYGHKLSNDANICPKDIMRDMRRSMVWNYCTRKRGWLCNMHGQLYTVRIRNVYPTVQHCICYYHLKQNLKKKAPKHGDILQLYKLVAYSYRTEVCDKYLTDISNIHCRAFDYLVDVGMERWSLAYCHEKRYGFMTTNIAEAINSAAKEARKLPITALVEFLKDLMQKWFHDRRKAANKVSSILTDFALEQDKKASVDRRLGIEDMHMPHTRVPKERLCSDYNTTQWLQTAYAPSVH
ncbi:hypothetical protein Ddye_021742 [Dipteronia dyeriana]|uniref:Transposase n=1 Tax=Dipteronia dyeriana TaxID=168575 RepID=A0AAD9WY06_9ROSI|nr:hypothetical protein Ddye_021742 [Dipteronia dyeriana]